MAVEAFKYSASLTVVLRRHGRRDPAKLCQLHRAISTRTHAPESTVAAERLSQSVTRSTEVFNGELALSLINS